MNRTRLLIEEDEGPEWIAVYYLGSATLDDNLTDEDTIEISLHAEDFETAVRYAQQYLRKMQTESETAETWKTAEILSVELY